MRTALLTGLGPADGSTVSRGLLQCA